MASHCFLFNLYQSVFELNNLLEEASSTSAWVFPSWPCFKVTLSYKYVLKTPSLCVDVIWAANFLRYSSSAQGFKSLFANAISASSAAFAFLLYTAAPAPAPIAAPNTVPPPIPTTATVFVSFNKELKSNNSLLHVNEEPAFSQTSAGLSLPTAPNNQLFVISLSLLYAATRIKHSAFDASQRA